VNQSLKISSIIFRSTLPVMLFLAAFWGCGDGERMAPLPAAPDDTPASAQGLTALGPAPYPDFPDTSWCRPGAWDWAWQRAQADSGGLAASGRARLLITRDRRQGRQALACTWTFDPPLFRTDRRDTILLLPRKRDRWHCQIWTSEIDSTGAPHLALPLALPRIPVESPDYADLVQLLAELTRPLFDSRVTHWPAGPIPVRVIAAVSGEVDLRECLVEAVQNWNQGETFPCFQIAQEAAWGVRLVHFPGVRLRPPMQARFTPRTGSNRPLLVQILVGDTYDDSWDRPYAVRGFAHELGHALLLWGHSRDRNHLLWASGPPLRDTPSGDERKAALLWRSLPEGLDLSVYFSAPESSREPWPPAGRP
jgi:hypothetical protein